jgi:hypothetical protein
VKLRTITLETGSERQKNAKRRLIGILKKYPDVEKFTFTDSLVIRDDGVSFSHPVLTLGAKQLESKKDDIEFLSVYVHENLHWFVSKHPEKLQCAKEAMHLLYPGVKIGSKEGGARNEDSTYLHLIVCFLEYFVLSELVGEDMARQVISNHLFYTWIYRKILEDSEVLKSTILEKCNLDPTL